MLNGVADHGKPHIQSGNGEKGDIFQVKSRAVQMRDKGADGGSGHDGHETRPKMYVLTVFRYPMMFANPHTPHVLLHRN